jgi:hypothetical protein
VAEWM